MRPELPTRCLVTVEAEADPQLPRRILDVFAVRSQLPTSFAMRVLDEERIEIQIELIDVDEPTAAILRERILKIPTVIGAWRTWRSI
jgi:hypothetical protein